MCQVCLAWCSSFVEWEAKNCWSPWCCKYNIIKDYFFNPLKTNLLTNLMDQGKITHDSKNLVWLLDEYSIVIQEFLQKRVEIWLETWCVWY
jgi:hypothetical protein